MNIKRYPTPISGLTLGIAGVVICWNLLLPHHRGVILWSGLLLVLVLLFPLLLKFIQYPRLLHEDLKHATVGSIVPTIAMTLMCLSYTLNTVSNLAAISLWSFAVFLHICFFLLFTYHRIIDFEMHHIVPSWFVPPIGIVVASVTMPAPFLLPIALSILSFGMVVYAVLLPIVLYRLFLHEKIEDLRKPTLALLAAPASLTLSGYLTLAPQINPLLVIALFGIAFLMTTTVYLMLIHLIRLPFSPAFSAYTFPLAISATATFKMSVWVGTVALLAQYVVALRYLAVFQVIVATLVITYVLVNYANYLLGLAAEGQ